MQLIEELREFDAVFSKMSPVEQTLRISPDMLNEMQRKKDRLRELQSTLGWSQDTVHNKLHEITWDSTAASRQSRHSSGEKISDAMRAHMLAVAQWAVAGGPNPGHNTAPHLTSPINESHRKRYILDVGCGTGLLCEYIQKAQMKSLSISSPSSLNNSKKKKSANSNSQSPSDSTCHVIGVDFSGEMIKIAKTNYPQSTFVLSDFLQFSFPDEVPEVDCIVFNESLHNFLDIKAALLHAKNLLLVSPSSSTPSSVGKKIVISNPKGFAGIVKQHAVNRWLCPHLLPNDQELSALANELNMEVVQRPDIQSAHYLAVLAIGQ